MSPQNAARSICIITRDLYNQSGRTDAGAASLGLAQHLAEIGENVTLVWVPPVSVSDNLDVTKQEELVDSFAENYLIDLHILTGSPALAPYLNSPEKESFLVYHYLKTNTFDEVYCSLEGGIAYYTLLAQEMELVKGRESFTLFVHSPAEWLAEVNKTLVSELRMLAILHMERHCLENSGSIVFGSQYIKDWMLKKGWKVPAKARIIQALQPYGILAGGDGKVAASRQRASKEIGFWPGTEFRKGLVLFCDMLDKIAQVGRQELTINIFGPLGLILGDNTGGMILRRARNWPFALRFFPRFTEEQSLHYLKQRNGIAVFPYLMTSGSRLFCASIDSDINVVATNVGSNHELFDRKQQRELCAATSVDLAQAILSAASKPQKRLVLAQSRLKVEETWRLFRAKQRHATSNRLDAQRRPTKIQNKLVSIVIAHYERPDFLGDAIKSVEQQDYPNIEVILVDDGSKGPAAIAFLKSLEPNFKKRGWKIIRQKNKYLGAARNAGIKASRGAYVLFLDDDNALIKDGVTTFVKALEASGADICTSVSKIFLGPHLPKNPSDGLIWYLPLGGSLDCAFVYNPLGDANAMIRKEVFAKIGYLVEDRGFSASDWEFFTRAALHDLKIRVIPDPTYWYRSSAEGMNRSSHWVESRLHILRLFEQHKFKGLSHIYQLLMYQNAQDVERKSYDFRLHYDPSNARYQELNQLEPDSNAALAHLAGTAASEGRPDTALNLLGQTGTRDFAKLTQLNLAITPPELQSSIEEPLALPLLEIFDMEKMKSFSVSSSDVAVEPPLCFVEKAGEIVLQSEPSAMIVATLTSALPPGSTTLSFYASLREERSSPVEIIAGLINPELPSIDGALEDSLESGRDLLATTEWIKLDQVFNKQKITLSLTSPAKATVSLAVCIRHVASPEPLRPMLVSLEGMSRTGYIGLGQPRRPRIGVPPMRQFARALTKEELKKAILGTAYGGDESYLKFPKTGGGFLLKPSVSGVVVAVLPYAFPAFAKGVSASVEIAHEDASPFEFSIALARPSELGSWNIYGPDSAVAFSGWKRVERKFELHEVALELAEARRYDLTICAAIRLPEGSVVAPAESYFRKIVLTW